MNTAFLLMARYNKSEVSLKEISEEYFGITPKTAEQKAKSGQLPIPTFKMRDSEKSPTLVKILDLAEYIDRRHNAAKKEWESVQAIGCS